MEDFSKLAKVFCHLIAYLLFFGLLADLLLAVLLYFALLPRLCHPEELVRNLQFRLPKPIGNTQHVTRSFGSSYRMPEELEWMNVPEQFGIVPLTPGYSLRD
jgi:hypothetical protein